jgi:hypothetical protein
LRTDASRIASLAADARAILDRGISRALTAQPDPAMATRLFHAIAGDAEEIAPRGERAAEQAGMALETLYTSSLAGNTESTAVRSAFDELFQQFQSPSAYDPRRFIAQVRKIDAAVR